MNYNNHSDHIGRRITDGMAAAGAVWLVWMLMTAFEHALSRGWIG